MMTSPAAQSFASLVTTTGLLFILWHTWHYDRFRCLLYTKQDWFRAMMCHILLLSVAFFMVWAWIDVYVAYQEYYVSLLGKTMVTPWQLWTAHEQRLVKVGLYMLCVGWALLQAVHLEEFLYWGYLIKSISTLGGPKTSWVSSTYFRVWVFAFAAGAALLIGAIQIETDNLDMMKAYLFIVGSSISVSLALASVVLSINMPRFMATVRHQGGTFEVMERLQFFREMNVYRTTFRLIYSIGFLILAADGLSTEKKVNKSDFWADLIFLWAEFSIFASSCLSVVVLLPRNMTAESFPTSLDQNFHPLVEFRYPASSRQGLKVSDIQKHFLELGDRLNIGHEALGELVQAVSMPGYELSIAGRNAAQYVRPTSPMGPISDEESGTGGRIDAPFAMTADRSRRARYSEFPTLPTVVQTFKSPFNVGEQKQAGPAKILVTSHTIVEE